MWVSLASHPDGDGMRFSPKKETMVRLTMTVIALDALINFIKTSNTAKAPQKPSTIKLSTVNVYDKSSSSKPSYLMYLLMAGSITFSALAVWLFYRDQRIAGSLLALLALALSAFLMGGPWSDKKPSVTILASILLALQLTFVIVLAVLGARSTTNLVALLELSAFGLFGLIIALLGVITWRPDIPFAESFALGIVGIWLGCSCLLPLPAFTGSLNYPHIYGRALLFGTGTATQGLALTVSVDPTTNEEFFTIQSGGRQKINWALMLIGDARIHNAFYVPINTKSIRMTHFPFQETASGPQNAQLFSGSISVGSSESVNGTSSARFTNSTSDRSAYSFPQYGQGDLQNMDPFTRQKIINALGGSSTYRVEGNFTTYVSSNNLGAFESVTQATPAVDSNLSATKLQWTSYYPLSINYATVDQDKLDSTSNALFIFAILLGVAGACVVGGIQGTIHEVLSRNRQAGSSKPAAAD